MEARYAEIAKKYAPQGIKIRWKRGKKLIPAWADLYLTAMLVPRPRTRDALYVYLHECAHFHLKHFNACDTLDPRLRLAYSGNGNLSMAHEEYEAERWAINVMRKEGLSVSKKMLKEAKKYVKSCLGKSTKRHSVDATTPKFVSSWVD
jgi:hypothetical protein